VLNVIEKKFQRQSTDSKGEIPLTQSLAAMFRRPSQADKLKKSGGEDTFPLDLKTPTSEDDYRELPRPKDNSEIVLEEVPREAKVNFKVGPDQVAPASKYSFTEVSSESEEESK